METNLVTCMLPVKDLARARRFYEGQLRLTAVGQKPDGKFVYRCGGAEIALFPKAEGTKAEHTALSFKVADIKAAIHDLESRGVTFADYDYPGLKTVEHVCVLGSEKAAWFTDEDRAFIESRAFFFLATADAAGQPDCSYKGGVPGFVRVAGPSELEFPSYDGNGMFRSLGNVRVNAKVGLLFLDFENPRRLRVNGTAELHTAQMMVRVRAERIFPNCPRYIHRMKLVELSVYAPAPGHTPPVPAWKRFPQFNEVLPPGDPARET